MEGNSDLGHPHKIVCLPLGLSVVKKKLNRFSESKRSLVVFFCK